MVVRMILFPLFPIGFKATDLGDLCSDLASDLCTDSSAACFGNVS